MLIHTQAFWDAKKNGYKLFAGKVEEIHMPNNSGVPFIMAISSSFGALQWYSVCSH